MKKPELVGVACITGFVGDFILQLAVKHGFGGVTGWGLKEYFQQHGSAEALFIAGGMMSIFYVIYLLFLEPNIWYLAIFGILLDLLFRKTMIFSSLKGYYKHLNYFWSAVWGAIPMMIPYFIYKIAFG
jgi:hypothetical protein